MELDKFIIGLLIFVAVIVGGVMIIGDLNSNYGFAGTNISTSDFGGVYDATDEIYNLSEDMKGSVLGGEVTEGTTEDSMFKGVYKALRFITSSFKVVGDIMNAMATKLGIPTFFIVLAMAALSITIIFSIIYIVFRIAKG
jgi:hypothetical protein